MDPVAAAFASPPGSESVSFEETLYRGPVHEVGRGPRRTSMLSDSEKPERQESVPSSHGLGWRRTVAVAVAAIMVCSVGLAVVGATLSASASSHAAPAPAVVGSGQGAAVPPPIVHEIQAKVGPSLHVSSSPSGGKGAVLATSGNWAGYAAIPSSTGEIQEVTAEWYVPVVTCPSSGFSGVSSQVSWVGIDGWGDGTVEQAGTLSYCSAPGATPAYYSWWEFFPYNDIQIVGTVGGADFVAAYVLYNPAECFSSSCGVYTLVFHDLDSGISWAVTGNPSVCNSAGCEGGTDASAECISEAPSGFGHSGIDPLAKYTTTTFYACAAEINGAFKGIASFGGTTTVYRINQVTSTDKNIQLTSPAITYYYGKSEFTITWKRFS
jgi:Peptidase A4 family